MNVCSLNTKVSTIVSSLSMVDDILQISTLEEMYEELEQGLKDAYGTITTHKEASAYLGMTLERSSCMGYVKVTQQGLIQKLVERGR